MAPKVLKKLFRLKVAESLAPVSKVQDKEVTVQDEEAHSRATCRSPRAKGKGKKFLEKEEVQGEEFAAEVQEEEEYALAPPSRPARKKTQKKKGKEPMLAVNESPREKFVNVAAKKRFEEMLKREPLPERGFEADMGKLPLFVSVVITNDGWESFCQKPESAIIPLVREFYANLQDNDLFQTKVRGKWIDWSPNAINEFYDIPNYPKQFLFHGDCSI